MNSIIRPFSIRHREEIFEKRIDISLSVRLRKRILKIIEDYNYEYYTSTESGYYYSEMLAEEVKRNLLKLYGEDELKIKDKNSKEIGKWGRAKK